MRGINTRIEEKHNRPNAHVRYDLPLMPYHVRFGELVKQYAENAESVIDIDCGLGHTLAEIETRLPRAKLFAADIDESTLAAAKRRVNRPGTFHTGTIEELFEMDQKFDVV